MDREKLFKKIEICGEALMFVKTLLDNNQKDEAESLLSDVKVLGSSIIDFLKAEENSSIIVRNAILCCRNMIYSIERFSMMPLKSYRIFKLEILESFRRVRLLVHRKYILLDNSLNLQKHRNQVMKDFQEAHTHILDDIEYKYKASIVVTAFNKLEYTKLAIESLMKYTNFSKGDIELITVNNGSADGTEAYFESLPHEKKINFKHNVTGIPIGADIYEGKYAISFPNDAVATPCWLEQLLFCMESSQDIVMITPTCSYDAISMNQGIVVPYKNKFSDMEKMEKFASEYNHSNPELWEERVIIAPFISVARSDMRALEMGDPCYTKSQFSDDDFSTLFRRTGWKMLLAKDTFVHHFGSVTLGDSKLASNQNALDEMRKVYFDKWGVDAWESRGILGIENIFQWISPQKESRILWIEPKFGTDFLSMKNFYRKNGCGDVKADAMVVDSRYLPDAKYYFDRCIPAENLLQAVSEVQEGYDLIGMSACLHEVVDGSAVALLEKLYGILKPGGQLLVPVKNWNSASCLKEIITSGGVHPWNCPANTFKGLSMWGLLEELAQHKCLKNYSRLVLAEPDAKLCKDMHSKLAKMFSDVYDSEDFKTILQINMMWLGFQKS